MSAFNAVDPVTQMLISQGMRPEVAYFGKSQFVVGWKICLVGAELVYRVEDKVLIICDFAAVDSSVESNRAVSHFILLIRQIERSVEKLHSVRGRFIESCAEQKLNCTRKRLSNVLQAKGASWQEVDGEQWLVYPLASKRRSVGD